MKVCDKCGERAYTSVLIELERQEYDLCNEHFSEFMEWAKEKPKPKEIQKDHNPKPRGRPKGKTKRAA